jgi:pyruvate formate lyase activating enzyme
MDFNGWEKLSLVDYDDYLTTTFFVSGCNFRCPFCHNKNLVLNPKDNPIIPWEKMLDYLRRRKNALDAVCVSGGEPTLMEGLEEKLQQIKSLGYLIKLDTNGTNPDLLKRLYERRLVDHFAMDIKNSKEKYAITAGLENFNTAKVEDSVSFLMNSGCSYEFRTTVMDEFHDEESFRDIARWLDGAKRYYLQRYVDSPNCIKGGFHELSKNKAEEFALLLRQHIEFVALRGYD